MSKTRVDLLLEAGTPLSWRTQRLKRFFLSLLAVWAVQASAAAQEPASSVPERVELRYVSAQNCPSQASFVNEVGARIRRPLEWVQVEPEFLISVTLGQT